MWHKPSLHFFLIGLALWLTQQFIFADTNQRAITLSKAKTEQLTTQWLKATGKVPSPEELTALQQSYIEEEALVQTALTQQFFQVDALIRNRLEMNMRFIGEAEAQHSTTPLWQKAIAMGMHEQDPVVRRRLVQLIEYQLRAQFSVPKPTDEKLKAFMLDNLERYSEKAKWSFKHIYFNSELSPSKTKAGSANAQQRALEWLQRLKTIDDQTAESLGDPSLIPREFNYATEQQIARYLGNPFVNALTELPIEQWSGPIASPYGWHLIYLYQNEQPKPPDLAQVKQQVAIDWGNQQLNEYLRSSKQAIAKRFEVVYLD